VDLATSFHDDSGIRVLVDADPVAEDLSDDVTRVLYRVAHEALVNAWRHGRCTTVRVSLTSTGTGIELQVRDDGVGFGRHSGDRISGVGLTMLRRLLRAVEGELRVGNVPPQGALLVATVPRPTA
jgi:two-component system NarL family sensor kinase